MEDDEIKVEKKQITLDDIEQPLKEKFKSLPKHLTFIATSMVGFTAIGYIIGWLYVRSYYSQFNALWLVSELTYIEIIAYSWRTIIGLAGGFYFAILILIENPKYKNYIYKAYKYGLYSIAALTSIFLILSFFDVDINRASALLQIPFLVAIIALILLFIYPENEKMDSSSIVKVILFIFIIYGFNQYIEHRGKADANDDLNIKYSSLSKINLKFDGRQSLRVLKLKGNLFYVVDLDTTNNKSNRIEVVDYKDVMYISKGK